jgi:hypothetical protein
MPIDPKLLPKTTREFLKEHIENTSLASLAREIVTAEKVLAPLSLPMRDSFIYQQPTPKEVNKFQSAGVLLSRMFDAVQMWRKEAPPDSQPVIMAILNGGQTIKVSSLYEESFHVLRITGEFDGNPCILLTHQSSVQLLCYVAKIDEESPRRQIGFFINGKKSDV